MDKLMIKSLFETRTFKGATITLVAGLMTLTVTCNYEKRLPNQTEAIGIVTLLSTYAWALVGRGQNTPVYTPDYLPGANKNDFISESSNCNNPR